MTSFGQCVRFVVPTTGLAFSDKDRVRVVEPLGVELWAGPACEERKTEARLRNSGHTHQDTVDPPGWSTSDLGPAGPGPA